MWARRFAILRMLTLNGDLPHGSQQQLAERFGVHKSVISRDVAWARKVDRWRKNDIFGDWLTPRCSYRRGAVTVTFVDTAVEDFFKDARNLQRKARKWLKAANRDNRFLR
jgi:hypothetical protein